MPTLREPRQQGHFTLLEETCDRLLFTRTPQQRRAVGLGFGLLTLILFAVAAYSLFRPRQDMGGFIAFVVFGLASTGVALSTFTAWIEIEFNRPRQEIIRNHIFLGKVMKRDTLPFGEVRNVAVKSISDEMEDSYAVHIFRKNEARSWIILPGYPAENQAARVRKKLLETLQL